MKPVKPPTPPFESFMGAKVPMKKSAKDTDKKSTRKGSRAGCR